MLRHFLKPDDCPFCGKVEIAKSNANIVFKDQSTSWLICSNFPSSRDLSGKGNVTVDWGYGEQNLAKFAAGNRRGTAGQFNCWFRSGERVFRWQDRRMSGDGEQACEEG